MMDNTDTVLYGVLYLTSSGGCKVYGITVWR